ncbi:MAG: MarC family protein [Actinomycetaceae bacterium]|nr:MarC family protein [Actinomycetaceae bacterium]
MSQWFDAIAFVTLFTTLFVIMDPVGNVPVFLALTSTMDRGHRKRASFQATVTSFAVIIMFALFGQYILDFLQISVEALRLSGGVLLFLVAMELLTGKEQTPQASNSEAVNVALVPLGTPLLAGPGAIVAVMVAVSNSANSLPGTLAIAAAIVIMHIVMWLSMRYSVLIADMLGEGGIMLLSRIAGLLLAAIATQMVATAVFDFIALHDNL